MPQKWRRETSTAIPGTYLSEHPHPTDSDIDDAMSGNICCSGAYVRIREAIKQAAQATGQFWA